jgi:type III pantothenate kinase
MDLDRDLLIVVDVGNTNTVFGAYRGDELVRQLRLSTETERTAEEYAALLLPLLERYDLDPECCSGVAISSVVPPLSPVFGRVATELFEREPLFVEPGVKTGLKIRYDNPAEVGADRICNAVAARALYGAPAVVVDFGTALTFDVVSPDGAYVGGIIAPGPDIAAEALFSQASRLFRVDLRQPDQLIGASTSGAMQSGLFYGYVGLVDGILARLVEEIDGLEAIVATGGRAALVADASSFIRETHPHLTLLGLKLIYERNRPDGDGRQ